MKLPKAESIEKREPSSEHDVDLTVLIPVFNEVGAVGDVVDEVFDELGNLSTRTELIVVDDGSTDGTSEVLADYSSGATVIHHDENRGYGAALKTGMAAAHGTWVCILDSDNTYPVDALPSLWARCQNGADMVVGARTGARANVPLLRRPAKWCLRRLASALIGHRITDLNSGFRIYRSLDVEEYLPLLPEGFSFTSTLTIAFLSDGRTVEFVPIDYFNRSGKSKIRPIRNTYEFFTLVLRTGVFFAPLRFFSPLGLSLMIASGLLIAYRAMIGEVFGVTSVVLFVAGLQLLSLGLLADLVNRRFATLSRKGTRRE